MKIKIDENLAGSIVDVLAGAGHDVDTVQDEDLVGASDPEVLEAAGDEQRLIITLDRGFGDVRRYPPGSHSDVLVLRLREQGPLAVGRAIERLLKSVDIESLVGSIAVWDDSRLRVRPSPRT